MKFNQFWTKEVNDKYRQLIKERKTYDEIVKELGDAINYHPDGKFKHSIPRYSEFENLVNEIKFNPKYISYFVNPIESPRYKNLTDFEYHFTINNTDYVLLLETIFDNVPELKNYKMYNVAFTTEEQYRKYIIYLDRFIRNNDVRFSELRNIFERETNKGDIIKIFNAISYILSKEIEKMSKPVVLIIDETENKKKINFYKKSIEDSFKNYEILHINNTYYFKIL